jgi:CRISPR-associated protein Cas1
VPVIKRTIEISQQAMHLSAQLDQLVCQPFDAGPGAAKSIPAEDIGLLLIDHPQVTFTHGALQTLLQHGAAALICGRNHLPAGLLLPISNQTEQVTRLWLQIRASRPLCKRLWQQIVVAKVKAQAAVAAADELTHGRLLNLAGEVKSGDTTNVEAQAAKVYWGTWRAEFKDFQRNPDGEDSINGQLNYGYAVMRAAVARALVAAGLHPALGLQHANRANAFCLADDLMEPLRPMVDQTVRQLQREGLADLAQPNKARLLGLLTAPTRLGDGTGPLMVQLPRVVASLVRSFEEKNPAIEVPWLLAWDP